MLFSLFTLSFAIPAFTIKVMNEKGEFDRQFNIEMDQSDFQDINQPKWSFHYEDLDTHVIADAPYNWLSITCKTIFKMVPNGSKLKIVVNGKLADEYFLKKDVWNQGQSLVFGSAAWRLFNHK
eukprot:NODE_850_length_3546_cov_0.564549.p2 type:complete len:123 gc:universal NODE_850_length_3546_cov_0.564549:2970-3338(+)